MLLVQICSKSRAKTNAKDAKETQKAQRVCKAEENPFGMITRKAKADAA
jgi:hypothetical protein